MPKQPPGEATIASDNGNDFAQAVFAFGCDQYMEAGRGIVVMREGDLTRNDDASIDAKLTYLSVDHHDEQIPREARDDLMDNDPEKEAVFVTLAGDGSAVVMRVKG